MRHSELSNAHDPDTRQLVQIIHPFHPMNGRRFRLVVSKYLWGEKQVTIEFSEGIYRSVPITWTDIAPVDPYISVGGGRSQFRVKDLLELARLLQGGQE